MQRERPDGEVLRWELVGLQKAFADPSFPFFIQWDVAESTLPGRSEAEHSVHPSGIAWVELGGDANEISAYVGDTDLDLRIVKGAKGLVRLGITLHEGEIRLG